MVCDWPGGLKFGVLWPERARDIVAEKRVISLKSAPHPDSLVLSLSVCPLLPRLSEPLRHYLYHKRGGSGKSQPPEAAPSPWPSQVLPGSATHSLLTLSRFPSFPDDVAPHRES